MDEVSKSLLKAKMFEYFRHVEETKRPLVVKDFGEPVLIIYPYKKKKTLEEVFGSHRKRIKIDEKLLLESEAEDWEDTV